MVFRKSKVLSVDDMVRIEDWLKHECIPKIGENLSDSKISEKLKLKVEYVPASKMPPYVEAELCTTDDPDYLGLIRVNENYRNSAFSYLHEIMHYIWDVGVGQKVETVFSRKVKGHTDSEHEQEINYATASYLIPYTAIEKKINEYDSTRPRMDELEFVDDISRRYGQPRDAVIRRIQEVRRIKKAKSKKR